MRVAALYDIHGNLPALEAVPAELEDAAPDLVVIGGDVAAGPLPGETLDRLAALGDRVRWVMGNADREVLEACDRGVRPEDVEDPIARLDAWVAQRITRDQRDLLASFEPVVNVGSALFCHGSPRSDTEIITAVSPEHRGGRGAHARRRPARPRRADPARAGRRRVHRTPLRGARDGVDPEPSRVRYELRIEE